MLGKGWRTSQKAQRTQVGDNYSHKNQRNHLKRSCMVQFLCEVLLQGAGLNHLNRAQGEACICILHSQGFQLRGKFLTLHPCLTPLLDGKEEIKDWALESVTALWAFHIYCSRASQDLNGSVLHSFIYHLQLICLFTMPREGTDAQLYNLTCRTVLSVQHFTRCKPGILASGATFSFTLITPL